mmetsp:Transcript_32846/g.68919  ORF Transcript_32846/g.68919 Transcript_32846/m.68919 type:complete len:212 (+) Transcript_32846:221-856(+)
MVNHLHISNNREGASEFLVDHKSKDTHHGGAAVVELDGTLGKLLLLIKVIPAEVNVSVTEVTNVLVASSLNVTHEGALQPSNEGDDLNKSSSGDGVRSEESSNSIGVRVEGISGGIDISGDVDSSTGDDVTQKGELTDTSVLDLNVTKTVETGLAGLVEESEGIPESDRGLGTEFGFEGGECRGGLGDGGRGEGGGGGDGGGEDGRLHDWN